MSCALWQYPVGWRLKWRDNQHYAMPLMLGNTGNKFKLPGSEWGINHFLLLMIDQFIDDTIAVQKNGTIQIASPYLDFMFLIH